MKKRKKEIADLHLGSLPTTTLGPNKGSGAEEEIRENVLGNCKEQKATLQEPGLEGPLHHYKRTVSQKKLVVGRMRRLSHRDTA